MNKTTKLLILLTLVFQSPRIEAKKPPEEVWLEINNATAFEEEFIRKDLQRKARGIIKFKRDDHFGADKGISYDGGIRITFVEDENDLFIESTRKFWVYNIDLEKIEIQSIKINRATLRLYQEINRLWAFVNSITHGALCHGATDMLDHTTWGVCRTDLSTNKGFWNKKHRRYLRKHLNLPGKTGIFLED
jgi:hypothetical protein